MNDIKTDWQPRLITIGEVTKHPNADSLSLVEVDGAPAIIRTGDFVKGDDAVYVPVDTIVDTTRPEFKFLAVGGNVTARIKARRLRGIFSMGLLIPVPEALKRDGVVPEDVISHFGLQKWIPESERRQEAHQNRLERHRQARLAKSQPRLPVYGLDNFRKYKHILCDGEVVCVTTKLHGSNFRACYHQNRLWVGSHKVMRGCSRSRFQEWADRIKLKLMSWFGIRHRAHTLAAAGDIWWEQAQALGLEKKLAKFPDIILYGEVYGENVQDLTYDSPKGRRLRFFDAYDLKAGRFLDYHDFVNLTETMGFGDDFRVPVLAVETWGSESADKWKAYADKAMSVLAPPGVKPHLEEGVVIKPVVERQHPLVGRVALKLISEQYLLRKTEE